MFMRWLSRIMSFIMLVCSFLGIKIGGGKVEVPKEMISYDSGRTTAIIALESNPSTGYNWEYELSDSAVIKVTDDQFIAGNRELVGTPGTRMVSFKGLTAGTATVTFRYLRSWEGEAVRMVVIRITVAADQTLTAQLVSDTAAESAP
ncbi:MAG: protease inhibitor I42 family protein [Clostridia bacterium]|nr:protease inhibitor I42 family protein [Clostridia bacterium]